MGKFEALLLVFGVSAPFFALIGLFVWWAAKQQKKRKEETLARVATQLGVSGVGKVSVSSLPDPVSGFEHDLDGVRFKVFPFQRGNYEFVEIQLITDKTLPLAVFRKEGWRDRLGKGLLLNREVQLGDAEFDREVYIETDETVEVVKQAVSDRRVRDGLLAAVRQGRTITFSKHGVSAVLPISLQAAADEQIRGHLAVLRELGAGLRDVPSAVGVHRGARGDKLLAAGWIGFGVLYLLTFLVSAMNPSLYEPLHSVGQQAAKRAALVAVALLFPLVFFYVRGHSRSLRNFFWTLLPGVFVVFFSTPMLFWWTNAFLGREPVAHVTGSILDRPRSRGSRTTTYRLKIALDPGEAASRVLPYQTINIIVPNSTWKELAIGQRVDVAVHPGAFSWPWIGDVTASGPAPSTPASSR